MNQTILIQAIKFTKLAIKLIILGENYDILLHVGEVYTVWSVPCHHLQQSICVALTPFFIFCFVFTHMRYFNWLSKIIIDLAIIYVKRSNNISIYFFGHCVVCPSSTNGFWLLFGMFKLFFLAIFKRDSLIIWRNCGNFGRRWMGIYKIQLWKRLPKKYHHQCSFKLD